MVYVLECRANGETEYRAVYIGDVMPMESLIDSCFEVYIEVRICITRAEFPKSRTFRHNYFTSAGPVTPPEPTDSRPGVKSTLYDHEGNPED